MNVYDVIVICLVVLKAACQSFVFCYTVAVLCGSLLFLVALCQHCNKAIIIIIIIIIIISLFTEKPTDKQTRRVIDYCSESAGVCTF